MLCQKRDALIRKAFNLQQQYINLCERKKDHLAKDEGVKEAIQTNYIKGQEELLKPINRTRRDAILDYQKKLEKQVVSAQSAANAEIEPGRHPIEADFPDDQMAIA